MRKRTMLTAGAAALAVGVAGCGGSSSSSGGGPQSTGPGAKAPEVSPPGDIPDNQAYVRFAPASGGFTVKVPEGWSRSSSRGTTTFTDKLNAIRVETAGAPAPLTVRAARHVELPKLARSVPGYRPGRVGTVTRRGGVAIRMTYLADAKPNPVTGKTGQDAVERYIFFHQGKDVILTLSGPKGADNVDPWKIVTDSVRWTR
jgi:hypothetical protein